MNTMRKKTYLWLLTGILAIILISNFTVVSYLLHENYTYRNYDGSFIGDEEAGGTGAFKTVEYKYQDFLAAHPNQKVKDNKLYRTFTIKPWRFWQWSDFLFCPQRFKLPYKARE